MSPVEITPQISAIQAKYGKTHNNENYCGKESDMCSNKMNDRSQETEKMRMRTRMATDP